jgi:hypothetical protein
MDNQSSFNSDIIYENNEFILNLLNDKTEILETTEIPSTLVSCIVYDLETEQEIEANNLDYHTYKNAGNWHYSKMIVSHSWQDKNNTEFFCDYLEFQLQTNNDCFENIHTVYYKNELDIDIIYSFETATAKHIVDNLRIPPFKPNGIIFNNPNDANKWSFKIIIITSKGIYSANRYITENIIGFY